MVLWLLCLPCCRTGRRRFSAEPSAHWLCCAGISLCIWPRSLHRSTSALLPLLCRTGCDYLATLPRSISRLWSLCSFRCAALSLAAFVCTSPMYLLPSSSCCVVHHPPARLPPTTAMLPCRCALCLTCVPAVNPPRSFDSDPNETLNVSWERMKLPPGMGSSKLLHRLACRIAGHSDSGWLTRGAGVAPTIQPVPSTDGRLPQFGIPDPLFHDHGLAVLLIHSLQVAGTST